MTTNPIELAEYKISGLVVRDDLTFEQYETLWNSLIQQKQSLGWWIGDAALQAIDRFGESASQAFNEYSAKTTAKYLWVCKMIPLDQRRDELTFTHHQTVCDESPERRNELLDRAVKEKLSTRDLGALLKELNAANDEPAPIPRGIKTPPAKTAEPFTPEALALALPQAGANEPASAPVAEPDQTPKPPDVPSAPAAPSPEPVRSNASPWSVDEAAPPEILRRIVYEARRSVTLNFFTDELRIAIEELTEWEDARAVKGKAA